MTVVAVYFSVTSVLLSKYLETGRTEAKKKLSTNRRALGFLLSLFHRLHPSHAREVDDAVFIALSLWFQLESDHCTTDYHSGHTSVLSLLLQVLLQG